MVQSVIATYDGQVLRPEEPLDLDPHKQYRVTIMPIDQEKDVDAWDVLDTLEGRLEAPEDWAVEHDHYLYGIPKREAE